MTDNQLQQLQGLIAGSLPVDDAITAADNLATIYPYFAFPSAMLLKNYGDRLPQEVSGRIHKRIALTASDPSTLYRLASPEAPEFDNFYPPQEKAGITTDDAISTFLENYGTPSDEETQMLERLIFNPVPDYGAMLEETAGTDSLPPDDDITARRIDSFMEAHPAIPETTPSDGDIHEQRTPAPRPAPDSLLSESLAQIYIKQRRYAKAFEIITQLNLNYPEKSCYFADQLRFLKKLIINQQQKTKQ